MKKSYMAQNSLELKLPIILCKTKNSHTQRKKMDIKDDNWILRMITPSSQLVQPLANLQNSLPQPFKR